MIPFFSVPSPSITSTGKKFHKIFGVHLAKFYDSVHRTGFDILAFDDWLETPIGVSTEDWLTKLYGKRACEFVRRLIGTRPQDL